MVQIFSYNDQSVSFKEVNGSVFVNATTMAKSFGKKPVHWLDNQQAKDFIGELSVVRNRTTADLLQVTQGGTPNEQGTWMHEDVALEFARWLSPAFAIWCNDRIKELLRHGFTATDATIEDMINNPDLLIGLATQLKEERAAKQLLEQQFQLQSDEIEKAAPKVQYHDQVLQSTELIPINVIAKELGLSAVTLNKILNSLNVIYRSGETWVLYSRFQNRGYTGTKTTSYTDSLGNSRTSIHTYWTEKGRLFIHQVVDAYRKNQASMAKSASVSSNR